MTFAWQFELIRIKNQTFDVNFIICIGFLMTFSAKNITNNDTKNELENDGFLNNID